MVKVNIIDKKGNFLAQNIDVVKSRGGSYTLDDLRNALYTVKKMDKNRMFFYSMKGGKRVTGLKPGDISINEGDEFEFKKLGIQIGYRTVFYIEYFVPMISFPLIYLLRDYIYPGYVATPLTTVQWIHFWIHTIHFFKREMESMFIHKFSNGTMPLMNVFKNSSYYWGYAFLCGYFVLAPYYSSPSLRSTLFFAACFLICMAANGYCHYILANLRKPGDKNKYIPRGFAFELVTCPNYFFEIAAWMIYFFQTRSFMVLAFALTGAGQMFIWAKGKHRQLKKLFNGENGKEQYPRSRKILVPYVI